jgi:signal transduction histidine kinase
VPDWWHDGVFVRGGHAATVLLLLYTGAVLIHRCVTASGLTRQSLAPLAIIGAVCAVAAAVDQAIWMLDLSSLHWVPAALIRDLSAAAIPVALLADLLRRRAASAAVSERVLAASRSGDTQALQAALRDVLVDRSLTVATATGHGTWVDAAGKPFLLDSPPERRTTVIRLADGTPLVAVSCSANAVQDEALWRTAMTAVEVGTENIRLNADLLARMAELTESRARIVEAGVAERRRVERDLHDGAQQQLLGVAATLARADLVKDEQIRQVVDDARERLAAALRELRQLARGIHPAALSQGGLAAALPSLCAAAPCPVEVHMDPDLSEHRPAPGQETAVYFLVAEALANIARHSHPSRVRIDVHRDQHKLFVSVHDDGAGGARIVPGGGLAGLTDRVEALGGRMTVHSDPCATHPDQTGSTISADFPINHTTHGTTTTPG